MNYFKSSLVLVYLLVLTTSTTSKKSKRSYKPVASEHCYGDLGCIKTTLEWFDPKLRPANNVPDSPHTIKTEFYVYKKGNDDKKGIPKGELMVITEEGIAELKLSGNIETKILIHDFTSSGEAGWMKHFMKSIFAKAEWNIIIVDWESGAVPPFVQAAANARLVALEIIYMLDLLMDKASLDLEDVHVIGQGLGAHIAGYVGEELSGLGRITGLDPTGVYFEGMPSAVRLDETDAVFVDVIHTDAIGVGHHGQGMFQPIGHVDFYPNGGSKQPGCSSNSTYPPLLKLTRNSIPPGKVLPGCSHKRASKYFTETVSNIDCPFIGFKCGNYSQLMSAECLKSSKPEKTGMRTVMGLMADAYSKPEEINEKYFLSTSEEADFCMYPYLIILGLARPKTAKKHIEGKIVVRLHQAETQIDLNLTPPHHQRYMEHGTDATFFIYNSVRVGAVDHMEMKWVYKSDAAHAAAICVLCNDSLYVANVTITALGFYPPKNQTSFMCSEENEYGEVKNGQTRVFVKCTARKKPKHFRRASDPEEGVDFQYY